MKTATLITISVLLLVPGFAARAESTWADPDMLALHWHPESAEEARRRTLALSAWLEEPGTDIGQWRQGLESRMVALERKAGQVRPSWAPAADGMLAWLVHARDQSLPGLAAVATMPSLLRVSELLQGEQAAGRLARMYASAAVQAPRIWQALHQRIDEEEGRDADAEIAEFWAPLLFSPPEATADMAAQEQDDDLVGVEPADGLVTDETRAAWNEYAHHQGRQVLRLADTRSSSAREAIIVRMLLDESMREWADERVLSSVWKLFEGLIRLATLDDTVELATAYQSWLNALAETEYPRLRRVDTDLPVVLALMEDAAAYLAAEEPGLTAAMTELADAYARLALFASDIAFYLDQPVREDIRNAIARCNPDPLLIGPLPREVFDDCLQQLTRLLIGELDREELTGGHSGPFAPEFLRREMGLVSWQRASYLDGHLNWRLETGCDIPPWINVLEWSILMQYLVHWVPQRPVFFGSGRWQNAMETIAGLARTNQQGRTAWLDCMTGMGSERRDPVIRLLTRQERAHASLAVALENAERQFYAENTRAGADINLDGPAEQITAYRPDTMRVVPCAELETCEARTELPVSRALLGLFPNAYLLADQLGMGRLQLCYGNVAWVDREARPARAGDERVANYHGRLSFDIVGSFEIEGSQQVVFSQRLTAEQTNHYLFASSEPELLEVDCPRAMAGKTIASHLPEDRLGLVPNRLTYFVSMPTTPEAQLVANWDRGAEWRDWFVTGGRVEQLEQGDGQALAVEVQARISSLVSRRERLLAGRMLNPLSVGEVDPLSLAMADVVENSALMRRLLEIHYPRVLRHHDELRGLMSGESGLINRDRVRQLRDAGVPMAQVPILGRARIEQLREQWQTLPLSVREFGQTSPEMDYALEQLDHLIWVSRLWTAGAESPAGP
jgi:hypothetical protein